jgi:hypothetical protein
MVLVTGHCFYGTLFMRHVSCMCVTTRQQASPTCQTVIITIFAKPIDQDFRGYALQRHYYPWRSGSPDVFCQSFKIVSSCFIFVVHIQFLQRKEFPQTCNTKQHETHHIINHRHDQVFSSCSGSNCSTRR